MRFTRQHDWTMRLLFFCLLRASVAFVVLGPQQPACCGSTALLLASNSADEDSVVTKEMLLRDMLAAADKKEEEEVIVRKKVKKGKKQRRDYKVMDNRDILPFQVRSQTPDPYTHPHTKRERAATTRKNKQAVEEQLMMVQSTLYKSTSNDSVGTSNKKKNNSKRNGSRTTNNNNDDAKTLLGEYQLHKDTTTGDTLLIGNAEYKVVRHRCQYKYAGGKRFVMVRKILEVKEVGRMLSERYLKQQWNKSSSEDGDDDATDVGLLE